MSFNVNIKLPSGKERRVSELNNKDYLTIVKFIENEDYQGLNLFFEDTILDADLNIFDRFYLLIYIRMLFIDDKLTINNDDRQIDISLVALLDSLESNYKDLETTFKEEDISIVLDLPTLSYFNMIDELLIGSIKSITFGNNTLDFFDLSETEKSNVLDNLPASVFQHIKQFIGTITTDLLDITIIAENESLGVERFGVDVIGNGVIHFISNLFATSLNEFYRTIYFFQNTITPGSDLFFNISPIESKIIMNHHNKRIKEENEQLQKQNNG